MKSLRIYSGKEINKHLYFSYIIFVLISLILAYIFSLSLTIITTLLFFPSLVLWLSYDVFWHSIILYIIISWKYYYFNDSLSLSQHIFILPVALISVLYFIYQNPRKFSIRKLIAVFCIIASLILSTIFAFNISSTIHFWILFIQFVSLYLLMSFTIKTKTKLNLFYKLITTIHILLLPFGVFDIVTGERRIGSLGYSSNEYGAFLGFSFFLILFSARKTKDKFIKVFFYSLTILVSILILATRSRGSQIALLVSLFFYMIFTITKVRKALIAVLLISLMILLFLNHYGQNYIERFDSTKIENYGSSEIERIAIWYSAIKLMQDSPIIGVGPNNFEKTYYRYNPFKNIFKFPVRRHAHSLYLNIGAEFGLLGLIILVFILIKIYKNIICYRKNNFQEIHFAASSLYGFFFFFLIFNLFGTAWTIVGRQVQTTNLIYFLFFTNNLNLLREK